jgi:hypothetical protein
MSRFSAKSQSTSHGNLRNILDPKFELSIKSRSISKITPTFGTDFPGIRRFQDDRSKESVQSHSCRYNSAFSGRSDNCSTGDPDYLTKPFSMKDIQASKPRIYNRRGSISDIRCIKSESKLRTFDFVERDPAFFRVASRGWHVFRFYLQRGHQNLGTRKRHRLDELANIAVFPVQRILQIFAWVLL